MESAMLAGILGSISQGVLVSGPDRLITFGNKAFSEITGYDKDELVGHSCRRLQGVATNQITIDAISSALDANVEFSGEILNYRKSGEPFWNDLTISPVFDEGGALRHLVGVTRDVTERKNAQSKIRKLEADYRFIFENVQAGVVLHKANTEIIHANPMACVLLGFEYDKAIGITASDPRWAFVREDGSLLPTSEYPVSRAVSSRAPVSNIVLGSKRNRDDRLFWLLCTAYPIIDDGGKVTEVLVSFTDITEQYALNAKLRQAHKLEALGQLTGGIAHDFNNLLLVISGNAEMLRDYGLGTEPCAMLDLIDRAAARGAQMTSRLLSFARKQPLAPQNIGIAEVLSQTKQLLLHAIPENISIAVHTEKELCLVYADRGQLENALINLAINARDAMPNGGSLTIEAVNVEFDSAFVEANPDFTLRKYVQISVSDDGQGMEREVLNRVFEPFFTTKPVGSGTGLGLSMAFGFAKQSDGHLSIYSEVGIGTTVNMYLPCSLEGETKAELLESDIKVLGGSETILIAEDEELVRVLISKQLVNLGYDIIVASCGEKALDVLRSDRTIDLLFTDMVMPGALGGPQLAKAALQLRPGLKVLFTSGYSENSISQVMLVDKHVNLLTKPYGRERLAKKLRELLD